MHQKCKFIIMNCASYNIIFVEYSFSIHVDTAAVQFAILEAVQRARILVPKR